MDNKTSIKYLSQCIDEIEPLKAEKNEGAKYERPHQSLANFTPASFYGNKEKKVG